MTIPTTPSSVMLGDWPGLWQDVFVTGAVLGVHCSSLPLSFFPDIYNEDWFFFAKEAAARRLPRVGQARQVPYDPFASPERARREEFGDLLAEGLYALMDENLGACRLRSNCAMSRRPTGQQFLDARCEVLTETMTQLRQFRDRDGEDGRVTSALASLQAAKSQIDDETITADLCANFVHDWLDDLNDWQRFSNSVNNVGSTREAMSFFLYDWKGGLGPSSELLKSIARGCLIRLRTPIGLWCPIGIAARTARRVEKPALAESARSQAPRVSSLSAVIVLEHPKRQARSPTPIRRSISASSRMRARDTPRRRCLGVTQTDSTCRVAEFSGSRTDEASPIRSLAVMSNNPRGCIERPQPPRRAPSRFVGVTRHEGMRRIEQRLQSRCAEHRPGYGEVPITADLMSIPSTAPGLHGRAELNCPELVAECKAEQGFPRPHQS